MIEAREAVIGYCQTLEGKANDAAVTGDTIGKIAVIASNAREQDIIVPIVGEFSVGKSTLINSILGDNILPVDVRPETSLATELRYSPENYILAVKESGETERYEVGEIKTVAANAGKYVYAQLFLNNDALSRMEPLVMVDMPGFNSPLDLHNKAITAYLDRGSYYVVLSSVVQGTITTSLERRLHEINGFGRDFSFFLSKANLRPEDSVKSLVEHYQGRLDSKFGRKTKVVPFGKSVEEVTKCLESIDSNAVFKKLFRDALLDVCDDIVTNINLQVRSSQKDAQKLQEAVGEMGKSVEKLKKKATSEIEDIRRRYSGPVVNDIVAEVGRALEASIEELVGVAITGNQDALSNLINEIIRSEMASSINQRLEGVSKQIARDFSESLGGLDRVMKDLELDDRYLQNITGKVGAVLASFKGMVPTGEGGNESKGTIENLGDKALPVLANPKVGLAMKGVGVGAFFLNPIVGAVIVLLPEIIKGIMMLLKPYQEQKKRDMARAKFTGEVFPQLKRKIRDEATTIMNNQLAITVQNVSEQFEAQIKKQEETIGSQIAQENTNIADKEAARQKLEAVRNDVQNIAGQIMAWGK